MVSAGGSSGVAAVAVAAGPIIGGFVTSNFSSRWVFVAEVFIAVTIMALSGRITDVDVEEAPRLDLVGAGLSALGLALVVFGVLQSTAWGWITPRVPEGPDATPAIGGVSATTWLILGGLAVLYAFLWWLHHRQDRGEAPLFDADLLQNRQLRGGLVLLTIQFVVSNGIFFMIPLFLTIVLGLNAFETGLRMLPLSVALILVAPSVPKLWPHASPRSVVRLGLITLAAGCALLAVLLDEGADATIVFVPFLLVGAALGLLASQLGNVIVSSEPVEKSSEVGGLQYTAQSLGGSFGTAVIGAVVVGGLAGLFLEELSEDPAVSAAVAEAAGTELEGGAEFVSNNELDVALTQTDLSEQEQEAFLDANSAARIRSLQRGAVVAALLALLGLFATRGVPDRSLAADDEPIVGGASP